MIDYRNKRTSHSINMNSLVLKEKIVEKIESAFLPSSLELIDETYKHKKHKYFMPGKGYFKLKLVSKELAKMNKLRSHQEIYQVLRELMGTEIHALSIKISEE